MSKWIEVPKELDAMIMVDDTIHISRAQIDLWYKFIIETRLNRHDEELTAHE